MIFDPAQRLAEIATELAPNIAIGKAAGRASVERAYASLKDSANAWLDSYVELMEKDQNESAAKHRRSIAP